MATKSWLNHNSELETQQVSQSSYAKETPNDRYNLLKVLDFASSLKRRRYFAGNISKLFKNWAPNAKINADDLHDASVRLGLPLN